ncbi:MAG: T9SS type A sorting domain-containing protein [Bacteroidota bacterium]
MNFTWTSLGTSVADGYRIYVVYPGSRYYSLFGTVTNGNASSYTNWSICNTAGGGGGYCPALSYSYAIRAYNSSGQLPLPSFYPSMANNGQSIEGSLDSPVYPNPAISQVNIKLNSLGVQGDLTKLEVYNSQGFLKMTSNDFTVEKGAINLDVSDLPKGEYILRINGMTSRFKVER